MNKTVTKHKDSGNNIAEDKTGRELEKHKKLLIIISLAVFAGGITAGLYFFLNKPVAKKKKKTEGAALVEIDSLKKTSLKVSIEAMGTVVAARRVGIAPRVGGEIVSVSPKLVPGGIFEKSEEMFHVDPEDYDIAVQQSLLALERSKHQVSRSKNDIVLRKSELAKARETLRVEKARCAVAKSEFDMLGEEIDEKDMELVLRKPQLASAEAAVEAAEAAVKSAEITLESARKEVELSKSALKDARLDRQRTSVVAPFNGRIIERSIELGSHVSPGQVAVEFAGSDEYWIRALVPVDQVQWIEFPSAGKKGSPVEVSNRDMWGDGIVRKGVAKVLLSDLEPRGRMARVLVSVKDPLGLKESNLPRMILGAYMELVIEGKKISDVVPVSREYLHEGNVVWIASEDDRLEIRKVKLAWSGKKIVYVSGEDLQAGEKLVVSDLPSPVGGQRIKIMQPSGEDGKLEDR